MWALTATWEDQVPGSGPQPDPALADVTVCGGNQQMDGLSEFQKNKNKSVFMMMMMITTIIILVLLKRPFWSDPPWLGPTVKTVPGSQAGRVLGRWRSGTWNSHGRDEEGGGAAAGVTVGT